jgi:hypothetical protein
VVELFCLAGADAGVLELAGVVVAAADVAFDVVGYVAAFAACVPHLVFPAVPAVVDDEPFHVAVFAVVGDVHLDHWVAGADGCCVWMLVVDGDHMQSGADLSCPPASAVWAGVVVAVGSVDDQQRLFVVGGFFLDGFLGWFFCWCVFVEVVEALRYSFEGFEVDGFAVLESFDFGEEEVA